MIEDPPASVPPPPAADDNETEPRLRRQLQDALSALEEARKELAQRGRLELLGQIAVGIGHELRQPLSVINNIAYCLRAALQEKAGDEHNPGPKASPLTYLDRLDEQVGLASRIISSLTEYARTQRPNRCPTNLNQLVQRQAARLQLPPNIRLETQLADKLVRVLVDPVHMERVFHILVTNAFQSMEASEGKVDLRTFSEAGGALLEVADTGPGIPEALREKLFQPFFSGRANGLGLGLALARQLLEANQGSIGFRSEPGRGACFQVRLPAAV